jgi:hypothetical protein
VHGALVRIPDLRSVWTSSSGSRQRLVPSDHADTSAGPVARHVPGPTYTVGNTWCWLSAVGGSCLGSPAFNDLFPARTDRNILVSHGLTTEERIDYGSHLHLSFIGGFGP